MGKKLAGLEEDAGDGGGGGAGTGEHEGGGAGTGGRRHGGAGAAATRERRRRRGGRAVPRPKKFVCHRVIKHPVVATTQPCILYSFST